MLVLIYTRKRKNVESGVKDKTRKREEWKENRRGLRKKEETVRRERRKERKRRRKERKRRRKERKRRGEERRGREEKKVVNVEETKSKSDTLSTT